MDDKVLLDTLEKYEVIVNVEVDPLKDNDSGYNVSNDITDAAIENDHGLCDDLKQLTTGESNVLNCDVKCKSLGENIKNKLTKDSTFTNAKKDVANQPLSEAGRSLVDKGLSIARARILENIFATNLLALDDLDNNTLGLIRSFPLNGLRTLASKVTSKDLNMAEDKNVLLCSLMQSWRDLQSNTNDTSKVIGGSMNLKKKRPQNESTAASVVSRPHPDKEVLCELLRTSGYRHDVTIGQRRFGPPGDFAEDHGSLSCGHEVFVGRLPKDMFEDTLVPLFQQVGILFDLRVMIDPGTGLGRGFCFVSYLSKEDACEAVQKFHNYEIRPNRRLQVNLSTPNLRLFVGNIPKNKAKETLQEEFSKFLDGIVDCIIYGVADDPQKKNRGFCFLEFKDHVTASTARRKLTKYPRLWNNDVVVDWADPQDEPDENTMDQVKVLYVKNLTSDVTEDMLASHFNKFGALERVKIVKDYGFIHFEERQAALQAMAQLQGSLVGRNTIVITLAKPVSERIKLRKEERRLKQQHIYQPVSAQGTDGFMAAGSTGYFSPMVPMFPRYYPHGWSSNFAYSLPQQPNHDYIAPGYGSMPPGAYPHYHQHYHETSGNVSQHLSGGFNNYYGSSGNGSHMNFSSPTAAAQHNMYFSPHSVSRFPQNSKSFRGGSNTSVNVNYNFPSSAGGYGSSQTHNLCNPYYAGGYHHQQQHNFYGAASGSGNNSTLRNLHNGARAGGRGQPSASDTRGGGSGVC